LGPLLVLSQNKETECFQEHNLFPDVLLIYVEAAPMLNYFQLLVFQKCYLKNPVFRVNITIFLNETAMYYGCHGAKNRIIITNGDDK
jgi:hypothetical protein